MENLLQHYKTLKECIPKIKEIVDMKGVCCPSVRDKRLKIVMERLFKRLDINEKAEEPLKAYSKFKKYILEDKSLTDEQKKELIKQM